jgi:hypothetical protein
MASAAAKADKQRRSCDIIGMVATSSPVVA